VLHGDRQGLTWLAEAQERRVGSLHPEIDVTTYK
jgi:hypothetical protein